MRGKLPVPRNSNQYVVLAASVTTLQISMKPHKNNGRAQSSQISFSQCRAWGSAAIREIRQ